jgi:hypothetical protein
MKSSSPKQSSHETERLIALEAEAERERHAKVINAEGEQLRY